MNVYVFLPRLRGAVAEDLSIMVEQLLEVVELPPSKNTPSMLMTSKRGSLEFRVMFQNVFNPN